MSKKRISLRLDNDQVAVVFPLEDAKHLVQVYEALAEWYPNYEAEYLDRADLVRGFIERAEVSGEDGWN